MTRLIWRFVKIFCLEILISVGLSIICLAVHQNTWNFLDFTIVMIGFIDIFLSTMQVCFKGVGAWEIVSTWRLSMPCLSHFHSLTFTLSQFNFHWPEKFLPVGRFRCKGPPCLQGSQTTPACLWGSELAGSIQTKLNPSPNTKLC